MLFATILFSHVSTQALAVPEGAGKLCMRHEWGLCRPTRDSQTVLVCASGVWHRTFHRDRVCINANLRPRSDLLDPPLNQPYYGISLHINTNDRDTAPTRSPAPVQINSLTSLSDIMATAITFDRKLHINVEPNDVECRAFEDSQGVIPIGGPITSRRPARFNHKTSLGSVICYITSH